ncbi:HAD hydrolase family IA variant 1 [Striga asiatica]|uniref:HAD hydrolase family IA variant 1 n=1 Tax=Striga asiatica TaxID=4170 RepID=A0A5A7PDF3_STRAF|nr:HAD hydrolase family IA variant 1 [Striga asiatica]
MSSKRVPKESKSTRFVYGPIRAAARAWDSYVNSLAGLTWPVTHASTMGSPMPHFSSVDSADHRSVDEELRAVMRLANTGSLAVKSGRRRKQFVVPLGGNSTATIDDILAASPLSIVTACEPNRLL